MDSVENLSAALNEASQHLPVDELYATADQLKATAATLHPDAAESPRIETIVDALDAARDRTLAAASNLVLAQELFGDYLTSIGAAGAPASRMQEIQPVPQDPITELWEGTMLTATEVRAVFDDLYAGKPVRSAATGIGAIGITDKELALITRREVGYRRIDDGTGFLPHVVMDKNTRAVIERIKGEFVALCQQDIDRGGLGFINMDELFEVRMGQFDEGNLLRWHVDPLRKPTIRYVVSFGTSGATNFSDMPIRAGDISASGYLKQGAAARVRPFNHGFGVVSRFLGDSGVHSTPRDPGRRLFMTLTATLRD